MPLISQRVRSIAQGVSKRPERLRRSDQVAEQLNMISTQMGVKRRPPTKHVSKINTSPLSAVFEHHITVSDDEKYIMAVGGGSIKVFDIATGTEFPVTMVGSAASYLGSSANFRSLTFNDKTVLLNRDKTVAALTTTSPSTVAEAMLFIRQADYSTTYSITIDGTTVVYKTPDANHPEDRDAISTDEIAKNILDALTFKALGPFAGYQFTPYGSSVIHIKRRTGFGNFPIDISVTDGLGDTALLLIQKTIQRFEDLPVVASPGFTVEVTGDPNTAFDNSYVRFDGAAQTWKEVIKPDTLTSLDSSTLPHLLSRIGIWATGLVVKEPPVPVIRIYKDSLVEDDGHGWDTDINSLSVDPNDDHILVEDSDLYQSTMTSAFLATINYAVDTLNLDPALTIRVEFRKNGSLQKPRTYTAGQLWEKEQFEIDVVSTDVLEVMLKYSTNETPANTNKRARVVLGGMDNESLPGISRTHYEKTVIAFDKHVTLPVDPSLTFGYPDLQITIDGSFSLTALSSDYALSAYNGLVSAYPTWNISLSSDGEISIGKPHGVDSVGATAYISPDAVSVSISWDRAKSAWCPATPLSSSPVGKVVKNLTDGSQTTITSYVDNLIGATVSLSGGGRNTFQDGDVLEIEGTAFVLSPAVWDNRDCGDLVTSPWPSFVGRKMQDVFFEQTRLGFITEDTVVMSCTSKPYRFFRQTATQLLPTDIIDVTYAASSQRVSFHSAQNWNGAVYLSHNLGQVKLYGDPVLAPSTVRMDAISWFPNSPAVQPVLDGASMYIARAFEGVVQVFEFRDPPQEEPSADEVTLEVPGYITGNPIAFTADSSIGFLALTTDTVRDTIYVYSHRRSGGQSVLESWSKWVLSPGSTILALEVSSGILAVVSKHADATYLDYIDVSSAMLPDTTTSKSNYLDRKLASPLSGSAGGSTTTVNLPYSLATDGSEGTIIAMTTNTSPPTQLVVTRPTTTTAVVAGASGDRQLDKMVVGISYTSSVTLGTLYRRDEQDEPETTGRTQIRSVNVEFANATDFDVSVASTGKTTVIATLNGAAVSGRFPTSVLSRNLEAQIVISTITSGAFTVTGLDWEGFYNDRDAKR